MRAVNAGAEGRCAGALAGLRVVDLTQMLAGPYGTMILADHGADVVKVEPPGGDMSRTVGPFAADDALRTHGGYFQSINRNKRSICLDLKTPAGRDALRTLARQADVLVENFRAGVMDRLGLGYDELRSANPRLVYGAIRGFGDARTGVSPYLDWPAFDVVAQAMGGVMGVTGPNPQLPTKVGPGIGDIVPGIMLAFGVLAAVRHAERTGAGQFFDVSMCDAMLAIGERAVYSYSVAGKVDGPEGNHHPLLCPFGMFPAADGYVTIAAPADRFFGELCKRLGAAHVAADPAYATQALRTQNRGSLIAELANVTGSFTKAELAERLGGHVPFGAVNTMEDIVADPHFAAREMIVEVEQPGRAAPIRVAGVPIKMSAAPGGVEFRAPFLGEDTCRCLSEAGLPDGDVDAMLDSGAAVQHRLEVAR